MRDVLNAGATELIEETVAAGAKPQAARVESATGGARTVALRTYWTASFDADLPRGVESGLADAVGKLEGIPRIATVRFGAADVVRHPLVGRIVEAYEGPGR